jgi:hypothetical protein
MLYLIFFFAFLTSLLGLEISNSATANACKPAARVININHPNYRKGDLICFDTVPKFLPVVKLRVVCLSTFSTLTLERATDLNRCPRNRYGNMPRFPRDPRGVTRSGSKYIDPVITLPYGNVIRSSKLVIRWIPVPAAKEYQITLDNGSDLRNFRTVQTRFVLDNLILGKSYQITIRAIGENVDGEVVLGILVLPRTDGQEIAELLGSIAQLQIPKEERLAMKVAVLSEYNLYDDAINIVTEELKVNKNLSLLRTLGDLYILVARPQEAIVAYRQYYEVAQLEKNNQAVYDAERLIKYVASYKPKTLLP